MKYLKIFVAIIIFNSFSAFANNQPTELLSAQQQFTALETATGGRVGISALNTENNMRIQHRANELFPFDCTSKTFVVAAILKKSMNNPLLLQERVHYTKKDLIEWSPITKKHIKDGMTVEQLCEAAMTVSDNTAVNLLLKKLGGPQAVNAFARSIGDKTFNLQDWWPNDANWQWGDVIDTSTPAAMETSLRKIILGDVLASPQRALLINWIKHNTTGNKRIRAGVPTGWVVGDKTGTNFYDGATGDIAVIWPPKCKPIVIAVYYKKDEKNAKKREDVIASATRIVIDTFAHNDQCLNKSR